MAPKAVIGASMHKLVRFIYGVLKSRVMFNANFPGSLFGFQDGM